MEMYVAYLKQKAFYGVGSQIKRVTTRCVSTPRLSQLAVSKIGDKIFPSDVREGRGGRQR